MAQTQKLAYRTEEILSEGNQKLRLELDQKLWRFTDGLVTEFKHLNKRLEDQVLFKIGYYQHAPAQANLPSEKPWEPIDPYKITRPQSASLSRPQLNFEKALSKATDDAGIRLKHCFQSEQVAELEPNQPSEIDMEWEIARL